MNPWRRLELIARLETIRKDIWTAPG